jgi:hypothetical protein
LQVSQQSAIVMKNLWFYKESYQLISLLPKLVLYKIKCSRELFSVYYCTTVFYFIDTS